jgi:hypothetical protein
MVGEIKAVSEHDPTRIAGRGFIPATCIFLGRSIRLATLDITIEAAPKEIGADTACQTGGRRKQEFRRRSWP